MDLFLYIVVSAVYIMLIHFAVAIKNQFNVFLMAGCFIFGGVVGYLMNSYESGFVLGIVLSLIFW
jgi:hypothetical protein